MAGFQWLGDRLRELSQLNNDSESADRGHFIEKLGKKINFIDCSFLENKKLGDLDLTPETWEEALDMHRAAFAKQKIYLRPRIFQKNALAQAPQQQQMEIERDGESQHSSPPSSSQRFTETQILYLRSQSAVRGVLQLHKLVTEKLEGYRILLRAEEVWAITKRSQLYSNFFTKLQDGLALDIAESWRLHVDTHMIRKSSYKGHGSKVAPNRIKIPFEGLTLPGAIFTASYVLQTRGCRPDVQKGAFDCLGVILGTCLCGSLKIPLLPGKEQCLLHIANGHVTLQSWKRFLDYAAATERWHHCKLLSKAEQNIDTGIRLHVATWFILRQPHQDKFQEAEKEIINIAEPEMPALQPDHEFHPMTKTTSDFMCRYLRRTQDDLKEELSQMTFKSVGVLCDASPKAKMIWLPIIVMPNKIGLATLQRLSGLLPSNASPEDKIQVAEMVADSRTVNVAVACTKQKELKKKLQLGQHLPKALNAIKEEKLSARQEMKAVMNILSHVGMSMDSFFPTNPLTAKVCGMEERQVLELNSENFAFIYNTRTGQSRWDVPMHSATQDIRLVLCADQGSPLYTCYQFLAFSGASIGLNDFEETSDEQLNFRRVMDILGKVGKNPFKCENDGGQQVKNYDKTVDTCVKVLTSEEYFALFQIARNILEPYRVLTVKFRRADSLSSALNEGHKMLLASIHEMMQYVLYLRSAPAKAAALLSTVEDDPTKGAVLKAMEQEWRLVLALEETPAGANLLRQNCSFCSFQQYRELMTVHEKSGWKMTRETAALTAAWFPPTAWSASLESVFGDLQDATKRSGRSDCGSLPNLFAVGVRSLQNRLCVQDGSTGQVKLRADDWTGTQALGPSTTELAPGQHVAVDNILKPFPSTTAFFHNHHCLNFMLGLRKAQQHPESKPGLKFSRAFADKHEPRQGKNPAEEAANFWVQGCFSSGMLLKYSGKFYLATGCTPAAVCLKELPYLFKGPLPTATTDETRVPCHPADDVDLLSRDSSTPALVLDIGRNMIQQLRFDYEEVKLFDYTLHVCEGSLADKCGSAVVLRRGSQEFCLLCFLVHSELILSSSSASLTELLQKHDIQMPKNSTKPHKVRRILAMEKVQEVCSARTIAKLLARLDEADAKKKSKEREKNEDDVVAEAEVQWEELQEDPAAQACQELLARLDEEEEKEMEEKEKEEDHQLPQAKRQHPSRRRSSRIELPGHCFPRPPPCLMIL
ncbi:unnamed protein product [Symbiodinium sp. CCMP2592]|nr:unnamed protein product [Symbiodinium sp. CCMP2592]